MGLSFNNPLSYAGICLAHCVYSYGEHGGLKVIYLKTVAKLLACALD
jgi:hypothetical protein